MPTFLKERHIMKNRKETVVTSVAGNLRAPAKNSVVSSNDLYSSDPDGKARQGRMACATAGGAIRPSLSLVYSMSLDKSCSSISYRDNSFLMSDDEGHIEGIKLVESTDSSGVYSYSTPIRKGANPVGLATPDREAIELSHISTILPTGDEKEGAKTVEILTRGFNTPERTMHTIAKSPPGTPLLGEALLAHGNFNMNETQYSTKISQTSLSQTSLADNDRNDSDVSASSSYEDAEDKSFSLEEEDQSFSSDEEDYTDVSEEGLETQWHGGSPDKSIPPRSLVGLVRSLSKKTRKQICDKDASDRPSRSAQRRPIGLADRVRRSLGRSKSARRAKNNEENGALATTPSILGSRLRSFRKKAPVPEPAAVALPILHTMKSGIYGFTQKTRDMVSVSCDR
jgi:hypothetical protein